MYQDWIRMHQLGTYARRQQTGRALLDLEPKTSLPVLLAL